MKYPGLMVVRTLLLLLSRDRRDVDLLRAILWMSPTQWLTRAAVMTVSSLCVRDRRSDTGATMERVSGGTSSVVPVRRRRLGVGEEEELVDFILFYFILFYFILFYFILFYFILFYFILFYFILFYFILFYFILFYFILFYFILFF